MATLETIHYIGCAKDISKSSRDRRKLGPDSTGNPVARKQALSGWKFHFRKQLLQSPCNQQEREKSIAKALHAPLEGWQKIFPSKERHDNFQLQTFSVSYSSCLSANEAEARISSSDLRWRHTSLQISLVGAAKLD